MDAVEAQAETGKNVTVGKFVRTLKTPHSNPKLVQYKVDFKKHDSVKDWKPEQTREPSARRPTERGLDQGTEALADWEFNLPETAITSDPNDHSRLVPIFDPENDEFKYLGLHNRGISNKIYAQQVLGCDRSGQEFAKLQLAYMQMQIEIRGKNPDPKKFRAGSWIEKSDTVITNTLGPSTESNSRAQIAISVPLYTSQWLTVSCKSTPAQHPVYSPSGPDSEM